MHDGKSRWCAGRLCALALLVLALAGCRKSMAPACRITCTCAPCTDRDLDTCLERAEKAQDDAVAKGCAEPFENFVECFEDTARCGDTTTASTDGCARAEQLLRTCADAGNPFATRCEEAQRKLASCFPGQTPPPPSECVGEVACVAECALAASCDALTGQDFDPEFADCVNRCSGIVNGPPPP